MGFIYQEHCVTLDAYTSMKGRFTCFKAKHFLYEPSAYRTSVLTLGFFLALQGLVRYTILRTRISSSFELI